MVDNSFQSIATKEAQINKLVVGDPGLKTLSSNNETIHTKRKEKNVLKIESEDDTSVLHFRSGSIDWEVINDRGPLLIKREYTVNAKWSDNDNPTFCFGDGNEITSAVLQANSTTKGFLPPRMTTTQKGDISSPAEGLIVYDTTLNKLCVYTGSSWETITSS